MYSIQKNKSIEKCEIWLEMECKWSATHSFIFVKSNQRASHINAW